MSCEKLVKRTGEEKACKRRPTLESTQMFFSRTARERCRTCDLPLVSDSGLVKLRFPTNRHTVVRSSRIVSLEEICSGQCTMG